jgi:hypothetical protein
MDCDYIYVAVFEATPDDPGDWICRARLKPTESPTWALTESPTEPPVEPLAPFAFYCMGDVPYTNDEAEILKGQINQMNDWIHPGSLLWSTLETLTIQTIHTVNSHILSMTFSISCGMHLSPTLF